MSAVPPRIGGVLLAAGMSTRMNGSNKLLLLLHGKPLVRHAAETLAGSGLAPLVAVTGHDDGAVAAALQGLPIALHHNRDYRHGLSRSLNVGLSALGEVDAALVMLGDMPGVKRATIAALVASWRPGHISVPVFEKCRGNPVLLGRCFFAEVKEITGDTGARALLRAHANKVIDVGVEDPGILRDIDTEKDARELLDAFLF